MVTETLTLITKCLFKLKLSSLVLFIDSFQSLKVLTQLLCSDLTLLPEINIHQLLPRKGNRKKLCLLSSFMSASISFALMIHMPIYFTLHSLISSIL